MSLEKITYCVIGACVALSLVLIALPNPPEVISKPECDLWIVESKAFTTPLHVYTHNWQEGAVCAPYEEL